MICRNCYVASRISVHPCKMSRLNVSGLRHLARSQNIPVARCNLVPNICLLCANGWKRSGKQPLSVWKNCLLISRPGELAGRRRRGSVKSRARDIAVQAMRRVMGSNRVRGKSPDFVSKRNLVLLRSHIHRFAVRSSRLTSVSRRIFERSPRPIVSFE